jgi:hypothetical protein
MPVLVKNIYVNNIDQTKTSKAKFRHSDKVNYFISSEKKIRF